MEIESIKTYKKDLLDDIQVLYIHTNIEAVITISAFCIHSFKKMLS